MRVQIDLAAFDELFRTFEHTAWRLETRAEYDVDEEAEMYDRFLAGAREDPTSIPGLAAWFEHIQTLCAAGKRLGRVRIYDEPPTGYQRYEAWVSRWNIAAGETIEILSRTTAHEIGLPTDTDWWLLDSRAVVRLIFDGSKLTGAELITDPEIVVQHCAWRDLAVHYSAPATAGQIAT